MFQSVFWSSAVDMETFWLSNTPEAYKEFQLLNHGLFFSGLVVFCFIFKPHIRFNFDNLSQSWKTVGCLSLSRFGFLYATALPTQQVLHTTAPDDCCYAHYFIYLFS